MPVVIGGIDTTETAALGQVTLSAGFDTDRGPVGSASGAGGGAGLGVTAAAVGIRVHGGLIDTTGGSSSCVRVKELQVWGTAVQTELVKLTDDATPDADEFLAPVVYGLLADANFGEPSVLRLDAGAATQAEARAMARAAIMRMLALQRRRTYTVEDMTTIPQLGQTVRMPDGYTGVVWECAPKYAAGKRSMTLTIVDLSYHEL
jgi:hypothetical protein